MLLILGVLEAGEWCFFPDRLPVWTHVNKVRETKEKTGQEEQEEEEQQQGGTRKQEGTGVRPRIFFSSPVIVDDCKASTETDLLDNESGDKKEGKQAKRP